MYISEMKQLSPMELTYVIRGAEAANTLEYFKVLSDMGMIRAENQMTAMYLGMSLKNNPEQIQSAKAVLEYKQEIEYREYKEKITGKAQEMPVLPVEETNEQQKQEKLEAGLLIALKCAVEAAVYRAKAALIAINNSAMQRAVASLERVQEEINQFQELNERSEDLRDSIKSGKSIEAETETVKEDESPVQEM